MAGFFKNLYNKVANRAEIEWDELEADLIAADLGVRVSLEIVEHLQGRNTDDKELTFTLYEGSLMNNKFAKAAKMAGRMVQAFSEPSFSLP